MRYPHDSVVTPEGKLLDPFEKPKRKLARIKKDKQKDDITIYHDSIERYEPFQSLQIRAIKVVDNNCEWVKDEEADFFGIYGMTCESEEGYNDGVHYCIADCKTRDIARSFNILSNFC